jgi:hypothetical protein
MCILFTSLRLIMVKNCVNNGKKIILSFSGTKLLFFLNFVTKDFK